MYISQVNYAIRCIQEILLRHDAAIEPKKDSQDEYMRRIHSDFQGTAWLTSCTSWYKNKKGKVTSLYPNTATRFQWELSRFSKKDYIGF